ncbi:hypothetical protein HNQ60_003481 [Povalibacter uvarum]|uniref:Uncharacterized protein n=1 Tax=Povalibacter uvarum TaxID=732238 RepID=A0A841HPM9_9GAMM|nr:hypothetical protein [Povalibacter uvarum]MBB6094594.1 hypothetical protein [Povalibacter uvarum]
MLNFFPDPLDESPIDEIGGFTPLGHPVSSLTARRIIDRRCWWSALLCAPAFLLACKVHAQEAPPASSDAEIVAERTQCLPDGTGYLRARLKGSIDAELDWGNADTGCTGAVRPTDGGIRVRFTRQSGSEGQLVLVFGIAALREGTSAKALPVNVTVMREGTGEFYGTQGDDKCTLDQVSQTPLVGIPHRSRVYRIVARGFCTEPARALKGNGSIFISRFDFAGRVDFDVEDDADDAVLQAGSQKGKHP